MEGDLRLLECSEVDVGGEHAVATGRVCGIERLVLATPEQANTQGPPALRTHTWA